MVQRKRCFDGAPNAPTRADRGTALAPTRPDSAPQWRPPPPPSHCPPSYPVFAQRRGSSWEKVRAWEGIGGATGATGATAATGDSLALLPSGSLSSRAGTPCTCTSMSSLLATVRPLSRSRLTVGAALLGPYIISCEAPFRATELGVYICVAPDWSLDGDPTSDAGTSQSLSEAQRLSEILTESQRILNSFRRSQKSLCELQRPQES